MNKKNLYEELPQIFADDIRKKKLSNHRGSLTWEKYFSSRLLCIQAADSQTIWKVMKSCHMPGIQNFAQRK